MEQELKPCPFCGGKPYMETFNYKDQEEEWVETGDYSAGCTNCEVYATPGPLKLMVEKWNNRVAPSGDNKGDC